jgi:hypothetical protein
MKSLLALLGYGIALCLMVLISYADAAYDWATSKNWTAPVVVFVIFVVLVLIYGKNHNDNSGSYGGCV